MPVLSNYWFEDTDFRGDTEFLSTAHPAGGWTWINWQDIGGRKSTLVWERQDNEIIVDLPPIVNLSNVVSALDGMLSGSSASRTSDIKAGWIPWKYVPDHEQDPNRHSDLDLLVHIFFNIHVRTPGYCTDADGDIDYYLVPYLDGSGHLGAYVDWWSFHFDGGWPFCTGAIHDALNNSVPAAIPTLQSLLDGLLSTFAKRTFETLYLLPGAADRSGVGSVNVNEHVSLVLLPS